MTIKVYQYYWLNQNSYHETFVFNGTYRLPPLKHKVSFFNIDGLTSIPIHIELWGHS